MMITYANQQLVDRSINEYNFLTDNPILGRKIIITMIKHVLEGKKVFQFQHDELNTHNDGQTRVIQTPIRVTEPRIANICQMRSRRIQSRNYEN